MKHADIIQTLDLEQKCALLSGGRFRTDSGASTISFGKRAGAVASDRAESKAADKPETEN